MHLMWLRLWMVTPMDSNGNHYISVRLHYFNNPRTDRVCYLGKKVVGGVDGERDLTVDERVKLGIGMSFADVEARGRMRSTRNTWKMRMHIPLVPLAPAAVAHFLLAEAVFLDLLGDPVVGLLQRVFETEMVEFDVPRLRRQMSEIRAQVDSINGKSISDMMNESSKVGSRIWPVEGLDNANVPFRMDSSRKNKAHKFKVKRT
ncbi:hypothetical protein C8J55DRAFT_493568 [Lentinula edodes]|uniref:Uncharacterized protein n=1 Tax=Lentinula lateritia TaxID=40482 RepID=A0A9W9DDU3_9AGAR|nr:hypothetical protein C8J55DRAFT_493568 [Lentinula edodes]